MTVSCVRPESPACSNLSQWLERITGPDGEELPERKDHGGHKLSSVTLDQTFWVISGVPFFEKRTVPEAGATWPSSLHAILM